MIAHSLLITLFNLIIKNSISFIYSSNLIKNKNAIKLVYCCTLGNLLFNLSAIEIQSQDLLESSPLIVIV